MPVRPGDLISGKYRIVRLIGDGGMGSVFEARHQGLGTAVALKFLHADLAERPGLAERFLREARIAATIQSPHVAHVTDVDVGPEGLPYLVMELLGGESLQQKLEREKKLAPSVAIDFALQIAAGLEAAHAVGVVHRDLKPDNVFVTQGTGGSLLKLIDFGIAKVAAASQETRGLTRAGVVMGTAEYMPPEQLYAAADVDGRADVYALGVILFEMLSGRRPADGDDAQVIVGKVMAGDVLSLAVLEPSLPTALVELVRRATAGDPVARVGSARELRVALAPFAAAPSAAGALAARPLPIEPTAPATKTLPPEARDSFAKGATEQAPPLAAGFAAIPALTPHGLPAPHVPARRAKKSKAGWLALLGLLLLGGAGAGGYALYAQQGGDLPPPPPPPEPTAAAPPEQAFTAEGQATTFTPSAPTPGAAPTAATPHETHGSGPAPAPTTTSTSDAGLFPVPLQLPSTFPPIALPSTFPTSFPTTIPNVLPSVLPTGFPTSFPGFPGLTPSPAPTATSAPDAGKKK